MRPLLFAALAVSLAACDSTGTGWPFPGSEVEGEGVEVTSAASLAQARAAWDAAEPDAYWLRYSVSCFCPPTVYDVRVAQGRVVEARANGEPIYDLGFERLPHTVDGLYEEAARAFATADAVTVRALPRSPRLPVTVSIDWIELAADDEVAYQIVAFAPLEVAER